MTITRRRFAQTAGLALIATGLAGSAGKLTAQSLGSGSLFSLSAGAYADPLASFTRQTFLPFVGTIFQPVSDENKRILLRLTEVPAHVSKYDQPRGIGGESFSLIFRGVGRNVLPAKTHIFEHASLGTFSLFISPVGRSAKKYQAVINHLSL